MRMMQHTPPMDKGRHSASLASGLDFLFVCGVNTHLSSSPTFFIIKPMEIDFSDLYLILRPSNMSLVSHLLE
jgi:hypothetical protein